MCRVADEPTTQTEQSAIEQRYEMMMSALDERNETHLRLFRWAGSLSLSLTFIVGAVLIFILSGSLNSVRAELRDAVATYVNNVISEGNENFDKIETLTQAFRDASTDLAEFQATLDSLRFLEKAPANIDEIPPGIYARLSEIGAAFGGQDATHDGLFPADEQYLEAVVLLQRAIDAGLRERMDPNEVFNSGIIAARMGFQAESGQLHAIAYSLRPTPDYRATLLSREDMFGIRYRVEGGQILRDDAPRETVRQEAWQSMLLMVGSAAMEAQTQVYSQAANMAERNRSLGYTEQLSGALSVVSTDRRDLVTAYTYATLADLETRSGGAGWREAFRRYQQASIAMLAEDSPNTPIYDPTRRNLLARANAVGELDQLLQSAREAGIDLMRP
jgi:hypothetical protein